MLNSTLMMTQERDETMSTQPPPTDPVAYQAWLSEFLTPAEAAVILKQVEPDGSTENGEEWLQRKRSTGGGPKFCRPSPKIILYRRGDLLDFLAANSHTSTSEYRPQRLPEASDGGLESTDDGVEGE